MLQKLATAEIDATSGGASFISDVSTGALSGGFAGAFVGGPAGTIPGMMAGAFGGGIYHVFPKMFK